MITFLTKNDTGITQINRGGYLKKLLYLNQGTWVSPQRYALQPGDRVYIGVMEPHQKWEDAIIRKKFTNADLDSDNNVVVEFNETDTINLLPGTYYIEMKIVLNENGTDHTYQLLPKRKFIIFD